MFYKLYLVFKAYFVIFKSINFRAVILMNLNDDFNE